jgi:hypothetical protein
MLEFCQDCVPYSKPASDQSALKMRPLKAKSSYILASDSSFRIAGARLLASDHGPGASSGRSRLQAAGSRLQSSGSEFLAPPQSLRLQTSGSKVQASGSGSRLQIRVSKLQTSGSRLQVVDSRFQTPGCKLQFLASGPDIFVFLFFSAKQHNFTSFFFHCSIFPFWSRPSSLIEDRLNRFLAEAP